MFSAYVERLEASGSSLAESTKNISKSQAYNNIINSPFLEYVTFNSSEDEQPCIVSSHKTHKIKRFLFTPKTPTSLGTLVHYKDAIYLATEIKDNEIYPEVFGTLCTETFPVYVGEEIVETVDNFGKKIYKKEKIIESVPCVADTKIYSSLDNSMLPLPTGAISVFIQHKDEYEIEVNQRFEMFGSEYSITTVSKSNIVNNSGFIEIYGQRVVNSNGA